MRSRSDSRDNQWWVSRSAFVIDSGATWWRSNLGRITPYRGPPTRRSLASGPWPRRRVLGGPRGRLIVRLSTSVRVLLWRQRGGFKTWAAWRTPRSGKACCRSSSGSPQQLPNVSRYKRTPWDPVAQVPQIVDTLDPGGSGEHVYAGLDSAEEGGPGEGLTGNGFPPRSWFDGSGSPMDTPAYGR